MQDSLFYLQQQGKSPGTSKDWVLDQQELEAAFSSKTKMIILNTPNNPFGKVMYLHGLASTACCVCACTHMKPEISGQLANAITDYSFGLFVPHCGVVPGVDQQLLGRQ